MGDLIGPLRATVVLSAVALTLTACGSSGPAPEAPGAPDATKGSSEKLVELSPLTGKPMPNGRPDHPVFIVKVENTEGGQPQYGLNKADMVIEELVEGGLTRLAAFYYSNLPTKVGHVRSMRASDIGIASPVGGQIVASGGAARTYKRVKNAGITIFSEDYGAPGFRSDPAKVRPYNRLVNLQTIARKAKDSRIFGPYLTWTPAKAATPASTGAAAPKRVTRADVRFSGSSHTRWAFSGHTWHRVNGHSAAGQDFKANTLVVLFCKIGDAGYLDPAGNPVPETDLKGTGRAMIFDGKELTKATWTKRGLHSTISFTGQDGSPVTIDPGHVFLELVPRSDGSVSTR
jgi:predicted small lipoprotein YifL